MLNRNNKCIAGLCVLCIGLLAPWGGALANQDEAETIRTSMAYLKTFTYGELRTPLSKLEAMVLRSAADEDLQRALENGFIMLLEDEATTPHALQFIVRQLAVMGSARSVPALTGRLDNPEVSDGVIRALETMPAVEAHAALRTAARETPYPHPDMTGRFQPKLGAIQALGRVGDRDAVPILMELVDHGAAEIRAGAYEALGRIGGGAACAFLADQLEAENNPSEALADACIRCAEALVDAGDMASAAALLDGLEEKSLPDYIQAAALNVRMTLDGVNQLALAFQGGAVEDSALQQIGVHWILRLDNEAISEGIANNLDDIEAEKLELVLKALAFRGETVASQGVVAFLESGAHPELAEQAIETLAYVGDVSAIETLAKIVLEGEGPQVALARQSLARLRGDAVNARLMEMAREGEAAHRLLAIETLGARKAYHAAPLMYELAVSDEEAIQAAALRSLQGIARVEDAGELLALLEAHPEFADQLEPILLGMAQRHRHEMDLSNTARHARDLDHVREPHVKTLALTVLGRLGDDDALAIVAAFLENDSRALRNHAARVLADANNVAVLPALAQVLEAHPRFDVSVRTAALRGVIRMLRETQSLTPEAKWRYLAMLKNAPELKISDDDARQMLGVVGTLPLREALEVLHAHRDDAPYPAEQDQALVQVAARIAGAYPEAVLEVMDSIDFSGHPEHIQNQVNHVRHIIHHSGEHLTAWKMAGPYRENALVGAALFGTAFAPEHDGEEVVWRVVQSGVLGDAPAQISLGNLYPETYEQTVYLRSTLRADAATDAVLTLLTPNSVRVWLNGEEVESAAMEQDLLPRHVNAPLALEAGDNDVMIALIQYNAGYFVEAQLHDGEGNVLHDIEQRVD